MLSSYKQIINRAHPSKLFLEVTTRCNLRCKMCVKQSCDNGIVSGDLTPATFEALKPGLASLDAVVISGVGEPLLHPLLETFIGEIKAHLPSSGSVGLQTNGTLLKPGRVERLVSSGLDSICVSVDAVNPDTLASLRAGAKFQQLESALGMLGKAGKGRSASIPRVGVQFVLMQDNMHHLSPVLEWAGRLGVDFVIVSHLLPFDVASSRRTAYSVSSDASIELFQQWRQKIDRAGLRIEDYPAASVKFYKRRTADEKKLIEMVEAMKTEGCRREISLDLGRLMATPEECIAQVGAIFEEAVATARSMGMDLVLPALQPTHARHCPFIEEGGVFVAWDGAVYPCHFTWHQYACYPEGRKKVVQPVCFGNLESTPLIDIWNSADYSAFRSSVLRYEFPYCGDCGFSPCDYIDGIEFEQDCHTNTIPCCDCPWPSGILNCLR